jgi:hypothetical protein
MFKQKLFVFDSFKAGEGLSDGIDKHRMARIEADVLKLADSPSPFVHIERYVFYDHSIILRALERPRRKFEKANQKLTQAMM